MSRVSFSSNFAFGERDANCYINTVVCLSLDLLKDCLIVCLARGLGALVTNDRLVNELIKSDASS